MPATGLICALVGCWSARRDYERLWAWGTVALMIAFALGLMFWQIRAAAAAQLIAIPPIAWAMWGAGRRAVHGALVAEDRGGAGRCGPRQRRLRL